MNVETTGKAECGMTRWIYAFGNGKADGDAGMAALLGGKGANLAEMASLGLPVPPGFTISTEACRHFYENDHTLPEDLGNELEAGMATVEKEVGRKFGSLEKPLFVSMAE